MNLTVEDIFAQRGAVCGASDEAANMRRGSRMFTAEQVKQIRRLRRTGVSFRRLATQFDTVPYAIQKIVSGASYGDVN